MPEPTKRFQCRHIFTDGRRCGSPCLRKPEGHEDFCYYHHTSRRPAPCIGRSRRRSTTFTLPLLEDRSAVQHSISQVLQKLAQNELDPRRAGLLLYGLQIASINLPPQKRAEPEKEATTVEEITTDPAHGTLAVDAELVVPEEKKGTATLLLEKFERQDALKAAQRILLEESANSVPTIRAVADPGHRKSTANPKHCKTLRTKVRPVGSATIELLLRRPSQLACSRRESNPDQKYQHPPSHNNRGRLAHALARDDGRADHQQRQRPQPEDVDRREQ